MIEKEYALKLRHELDEQIFQKYICFYKYKHDEEELSKCDYKILQKECNELGFYIFKVKDAPIFKEEHNKMRYKNEAYIIYSDYSLTLRKKFKDLKSEKRN